jgi:hypothetical protein
MKKILLANFLSLFAAATLYAAGESKPAGARATGIGNASVTLIDVFATTNNQAALGFLKGSEFGVYSDIRFLQAGINNINGAAAVNFDKIGTFGMSVNYFGYRLYNESKVGLAYGRNFGKKFAMGLQFDYMRFFIAENGQLHLFTAELGFLYKPWKQLSIGAHIFNPIPYKIDRVYNNDRLPTILKLGIGYEPSQKVLIAVEYEQDIHHKPQIKGGVDYRLIKFFHLRAGIQTTPFSASFGFGVNYKNFFLDASSAYHTVLGFTPQLSLRYSLLPKKKTEAAQP